MPVLLNNTTQWSSLVQLSPIVWRKTLVARMEEAQMSIDLFDEDFVDQFNRDYSVIAASGFSSIIAEGANYPTLLNSKGDTMSLTVRKYGKSFTMTEDLVDGNKYREVEIGMGDLANVIVRGLWMDTTHHWFTFGFSTSYTDRDGNTVTNGVARASTEAIFANTHTMDDGSTYDNLAGTTALNEAGLRTALDLTNTFLDENGQKAHWGLARKVLVTAKDAANEQNAQRLTKQEYALNDTNRDINTYQGVFQHVPLFYGDTSASGANDATKTKYWAILDTELMKNSAILATHTRPTLAEPGTDIHNRGVVWTSKARYDLGVLAANIGVGSNTTV